MTMKIRAKRLSRLELTAYHEAGHAVAAYILHVRPRKASIIPDHPKNSLGRVTHSPLPVSVQHQISEGYIDTSRSRGFIERHAMVSLAGDVAVRIVTGQVNGKAPHVGPSQDFQNVFSILPCGFNVHMRALNPLTRRMKRIPTDVEASAYAEWLWWRTIRLLSNPFAKRGLRAVARALLRDRELGERGLRQIIERAFLTDSGFSSDLDD